MCPSFETTIESAGRWWARRAGLVKARLVVRAAQVDLDCHSFARSRQPGERRTTRWYRLAEESTCSCGRLASHIELKKGSWSVRRKSNADWGIFVSKAGDKFLGRGRRRGVTSLFSPGESRRQRFYGTFRPKLLVLIPVRLGCWYKKPALPALSPRRRFPGHSSFILHQSTFQQCVFLPVLPFARP